MGYTFFLVLKLLYSHLLIHAEICIYRLDTYRCNDKVARTDDAHRKTQEDFFITYFTSHLFCKFRTGYSKFACERELETEHYWNILTPKSWPSALCLSRSSWLLNRTLEYTLLCAGFPYHTASTSVFHCTACPPSRLSPTVLNSSALYYLQTPTQ